jgi:hypothetical protein
MSSSFGSMQSDDHEDGTMGVGLLQKYAHFMIIDPFCESFVNVFFFV